MAVCLPAFNERDNLEVLLPELERALISLALPLPLVVVFDDGSTDGTSSWLRRCEFFGYQFVVMRSMVRVGSPLFRQQVGCLFGCLMLLLLA